MTSTPEPGVADADASAPAIGRVARKHQRQVDAILAATAQVLATSGYHAVSMERIGDVLDLSKASLYHYFPSKEALVHAAISRVAGQAIDRLEAVAATPASPDHRLRQLIQEQLRILLFHYPEVTRVFAEHQDWPDIHRTEVRVLRERHNEIFMKVIEDGIADGSLSPLSSDVALHCLHGALNYATVWCRNKKKAQHQILEITDAVMQMFAPQGTRDPSLQEAALQTAIDRSASVGRDTNIGFELATAPQLAQDIQ